jgi:hypothetical protein
LRQAILGIAAARQEAEVHMPQLGASVLVSRTTRSTRKS